jgi:hypothetical protein
MVKGTRLNAMFICTLCVLFVSEEKLEVKYYKCEVQYKVDTGVSV